MNKKILVVEDDRGISGSIKEFLEDNGFVVEVAENGFEALQNLENSKPNLILLDLMMPIMDGFEFREQQLRDSNISNIPVVIMSADGHVAEKKVRTSALDYLKKPIDIFNLLSVVQKFSV